MNPQEIEDRTLLVEPSRQRRIAAGAGINLLEVRRFLEEFDEVALITEAVQGQSLFARLRYAQKEIDDIRQHVARQIHPPARKSGPPLLSDVPHELHFGTVVNHAAGGDWEVRLDDGQLVVAKSRTGNRDSIARIEPGAAVYVMPDPEEPFRAWIVEVLRDGAV